jgi:starch phosphorylase
MVQVAREIESSIHQKISLVEEQTSKRILPEPLEALERLSWNYWWSWAKDGASVYRDLDPTVWEECEHNPRKLLNEVSEFRLMQMATDPVYYARVRQLVENFDEYISFAREAGKAYAKYGITPENPVAYFCAEYGVHNSLPLYSGGLGILSGDHLKSASDLGVPLVGIGLLYRYGYFRQRLTRDGWQEEHYGETHPDELTIKRVYDKNDEPVFVEVMMRGRLVKANIWKVDVGRVTLYLLDTNIDDNEEIDRWVTGHLYGGDKETRIVQEMMLGIGGIRLLRKLEIEPSVFHLNEGHSAFLTLELTREKTKAGLSFEEAAKEVRERCTFTTHTPVAAGNDEFDPEMLMKCFGDDYEKELGLSRKEFLAMGRVGGEDSKEWFGMTPLAIRMCRSTNGVSRKHGEVSRNLWVKMFAPETKSEDVPITFVTNGVHSPTWVAPLMRDIYEKYIGSDWHNIINLADVWRQAVEGIPDEELWRAHSLLKQRLVAFVRQRSYHAREHRGEKESYKNAAKTMFEPDALTIGFARRIAGYKRWGLLLTDPERLMRLIDDVERPVQFVFAGKAHPQDQDAKLILQRLAIWKYDERVMQRAVFLQDYDQEIARQLVQSVDVWMNVPRRPLEASGTSGQKVAINGGLNFSVLDGWWIEGYDAKKPNGWAIGDHHSEKDDESPATDKQDANSLYEVLESQIVPLYYDRNIDGVPRNWIKMMKHAIATLAPAFNSDRMVLDYVKKIYAK